MTGIVFGQILVENTRQAINDGDTKKFLAEGQPNAGREGHLYAVGFHRYNQFPCLVILDSILPLFLLIYFAVSSHLLHYLSDFLLANYCFSVSMTKENVQKLPLVGILVPRCEIYLVMISSEIGPSF